MFTECFTLRIYAVIFSSCDVMGYARWGWTIHFLVLVTFVGTIFNAFCSQLQYMYFATLSEGEGTFFITMADQMSRKKAIIYPHSGIIL